jgi:hypothetical protein
MDFDLLSGSQTDLSVLCLWGPKMSVIGLYKPPSDGACSRRLIWLTLSFVLNSVDLRE